MQPVSRLVSSTSSRVDHPHLARATLKLSSVGLGFGDPITGLEGTKLYTV